MVAKSEFSGQFVENSGYKRRGRLDCAGAFCQTNI